MGLQPVLLSLLLASTTATERVDLKGIVHDGSGAPIKEASVFIFTAQPRKGVGTICPSCYLDCWRQATTDAAGRFVIEKVDGSLLFRVGAVTPKHDAAFANKVDPLKGDADITLSARAPVPEDARRVVRARLVDLDGQPVPRGVLTPKGVRGDGGQSYSSSSGMPPVTITDETGMATMVASHAVDGVFILEASARGLVTTIFDVPPSLEEQKLAIGPGSIVRGRLVKDGRPLSDVNIGIAQMERSNGTFIGEITATTGSDGRFVLANVPVQEVTILYAKTADCGKYGAADAKYVETPNHGGVVDIGDLPVKATPRLTGRVVLPDGQPLPPDSTLSLHRQTAWDHVRVALAADGTFATESLPNEPLSINLGVRGYRVSKTNPGVGVRGTVWIAPLERDRELSLILEPDASKTGR